MLLDIKKIRVYLISPGEGKYRERALTVLGRLMDAGFQHVTFFKSVKGMNNTASLTNTMLEIFSRELHTEDPFIVLEDDCAIFHDTNTVEIPDTAAALYLGVALWSYPYGVETLYGSRPHIVQNSPLTVTSVSDILTRLRGMTGGHAILFRSRDFIKEFIRQMDLISNTVKDLPHDLLLSSLHLSFEVMALKKPMFYQDKTLGGQEEVTKLVFNGENYR
jgi:hypothetical protein